MKIRCTCGDIISDQTDYLPNKAYIIGDKNYFDFLDAIDEAIENKQEDRERLCMNIRRAEPSKIAYECNACGRLYLYNMGGDLLEYVPQNGKTNQIFDRPRLRKSNSN